LSIQLLLQFRTLQILLTTIVVIINLYIGLVAIILADIGLVAIVGRHLGSLLQSIESPHRVADKSAP
jgi:hypothetical protein